MLKLVQFLQPSNFLNIAVRTTARFNPRPNKRHLYKDEDRQLIEGRISYYPRYKDEPEPDHDPPKLFKVIRIKKIRGLPHWEKRILRDLDLYRGGNMAIVKNIPEMNALLWKVKHCVRIEPITYKYGEPKPEDVNHTYLKDNGECLVVKPLRASIGRQVHLTNKTKEKDGLLGKKILDRDSRMKWLNPW